MQPSTFFTALALVGAAWATLPSASLAGLPQPMCVYYGQAKDGYGQPYLRDADVILRHGTNEIARQTIRGSLTPGVNFALYVHLDDGRSAGSYSSRALHSGDRISIVVRDRNGETIVMENQALPTVGQPGDLVWRNVTAAEDADMDGLPDTWERELIAASDGLLNSLTEVNGADDFDGDGMSNRQEYLAGTFPFLDYDSLYVEQSALTSNGRLRLSFLSVPGKAYSIQSASKLNPAVWTSCPLGLSDTAALQTLPTEGNGDWVSLYVPVSAGAGFFRVVVE